MKVWLLSHFHSALFFSTHRACSSTTLKDFGAFLMSSIIPTGGGAPIAEIWGGVGVVEAERIQGGAPM